MATAEVTVRGAGVMGLCAALALARRGLAVQVIDPGGPGAGASGGVVGALAPHVPEQWNPKKAFQLQALLMAESFWAGVAAEGGLDPGYGRTGRLQPALDVDLATARAAGAAALWGGQASWQVQDQAGNPWGVTSPTRKLVMDTLSARIAPRRAVAALVAALGARGVTVQADGAERGTIVHATGHAGLRALLPADSPPTVGGEKGQAALLAFAAPDWPQVYADSVHLVPQTDGTVAVGSTSERDWDRDDNTDDRLEALIAKALQIAPVLADAPVVARWAGVRPRWRTRAPLLGAWPGRPGQFIANGGYKIGFALAPLMAERLADLIIIGRADIPPDFLPG
jgi:glycine oxidase